MNRRNLLRTSTLAGAGSLLAPVLAGSAAAVQQYALSNDIVSRIGCPMLAADPDGEQLWPGQSQQLYQALPGPKALVPFTRAEGADLHCERKAPGLRAQRIFDWLDATLA
jgi:hypothetical protein